MAARQVHSPSLQLENVAVIRGNRLVLDRFSLVAGAGDIIWLRGANGSGKSTLLRLIAGLLQAVSGNVEIDGRVALADENLALDINLTVDRALRFWAKMDGTVPADLDAAMIAMDLMALADIPVRFLSTGQRKRANLARVLASCAPVWLLDEPYNGLDSASAARLDAALLKHSAAGGMALVAAHQAPSVNVAQSLLLDRKAAA
ncbi:MAG TPA: heme ABC exporter ATP-binding protein CcmA [Sphingorhabdus sp.]|jgi:heme exporter protein A|nr:heme ABC exporter ATP-binding protein CcmA [Sphingorhabdus sp.]